KVRLQWPNRPASRRTPTRVRRAPALPFNGTPSTSTLQAGITRARSLSAIPCPPGLLRLIYDSRDFGSDCVDSDAGLEIGFLADISKPDGWSGHHLDQARGHRCSSRS